MKKVAFLLIATLALMMPNCLMSQHPEDGVARHCVKVGFLSPFLGAPAFSYEYRIGIRSAVSADLGFVIPFESGVTRGVKGFFMQAQYRVYPWKQRRSRLCPFAAIGVNYAQGWHKVNLMTGNDGWYVETVPYTMKQIRVRPSLSIGIKMNIPFGLTIENTVGMLLAKHNDDGLIYHNLDFSNYASTLITMKIGWSFDSKRTKQQIKSVEAFEKSED